MTDFTELSHYDSVMAGAVEMGFTLSDLHNRDKDSVRLLLFFFFFHAATFRRQHSAMSLLFTDK